MVSAPAFGEEARQACLTCHPSHHNEEGRCQDCHRGNPSSERKNIAHAGFISGKYARYTLGDRTYLNSGNRLIDQYSCRRCHVINGRGNRLAINLDASALQKTPEALVASIRRPVANMPDFTVNEEYVTLLVNTILGASKAFKGEVAAPVTVHFNFGHNKSGDVFTRTCGSCHRLLSERRGALGAGNIGPNLSGVLSPHYPKSFKGSEPWTSENLEIWLKNPRKVKPLTTMKPIKLSADEAREIELTISLHSK